MRRYEQQRLVLLKPQLTEEYDRDDMQEAEKEKEHIGKALKASGVAIFVGAGIHVIPVSLRLMESLYEPVLLLYRRMIRFKRRVLKYMKPN